MVKGGVSGFLFFSKGRVARVLSENWKETEEDKKKKNNPKNEKEEKKLLCASEKTYTIPAGRPQMVVSARTWERQSFKNKKK